jgi:glycosyltransferase involved in cell wall biosynthesis
VKILILTQYFPPETGAAQNRLWNLAVRLQRKGASVTVLTAMPNYPQMRIQEKYRGKFYVQEVMDSLTVQRCWLYAGTSKSILPRLLNYFSFVKTSFLVGCFKLGKFDYILCESPPLFLGITAWLLKKIKHARLIFNVSDLWPESAEKLGLISNRFLLRVTTRLEEFLYRSSFMITGQTNGIVENISQRFPDKTVYWLKNGIDSSGYKDLSEDNSSWRRNHGFADTDFLILYAGILGHAQGLEVILKAAQLLKESRNIRFVLIGTGPERDKLLRMKEELAAENVAFFDPVPRNELLDVIACADAAVIPLRRIDLFRGAIPSKIFENLAMKKPVLLGVEGEAKILFVDEGKAGMAFIPGDEKDLAEKARYLSLHPELAREYGENGYRYVNEMFNWDTIADEFWKLIHPIKGKNEPGT